MSELLTTMLEARQRFMDLVVEVRPELHRYCVRMTGSVFDGEDVVQDTLAKAFYALAELETAPPLRPWLFRIAHNTAMDFLRRSEHRRTMHLDDPEFELTEPAVAETSAPDVERVEAAISIFARLPPVQRSALVLKDVVGLSLAETAETMNCTVAAVKGALVRARKNVAEEAKATSAMTEAADLERLRRYAALFNARDWQGLRALFGEETKLDVVSRYQRRGRAAAVYFTRYEEVAPSEQLRAEAGWVDGVRAIAIFRPTASTRPAYFIRLDWAGTSIEQVRDFRYVPYISTDATFTRA